MPHYDLLPLYSYISTARSRKSPTSQGLSGSGCKFGLAWLITSDVALTVSQKKKTFTGSIEKYRNLYL